MLGREREIAALDQVLERGLGDGAVAVIEGEGGIGKTTLLAAVADRARSHRLRIAFAAAAEREQALAFGVVRTLLEPSLATLDEDARARVLEGAAAAGSAAITGKLETAAPLTAIHGIYWLSSNLAEERPLVLLVDDLQWSDSESLQALAHLANRIEGTRITLIAATRPIGPGSEAFALMQAPPADVIRPQPLAPDAAAALLETAGGTPPDEGFVEAVLDASGGNPFLITEIGRTLAEQGFEPRSHLAGRVAKLAPEGVRHELALRLARLTPEAAALAKAVAVLGDGCLAGDAAAVSKLDVEALSAAEVELQAAGVLANADGLAFRHPIIQATAYAGLTASERALLHERASKVLTARAAPDDSIAAQLLHTEPSGRGETAELLARAGKRALERGATSSAVRLLLRAREEPPSADQRAEVLRDLGISELRTGADEAVDHLREALDLTRDTDEAAALTRHVAVALLMRGELGGAFDVLEKAADRTAGESGEARLSAEADLCSVGFISTETAPRAAERVARVAPAITPATPPARVLLALLAFLRVAMGEPVTEAADTAERALADGRLVTDQLPDGPALYMALDVLVDAERFELFDRVLDHAVEDARERGSILGFASASAYRAHGHWYRGALQAAGADAESAYAAARQAWRLGIPIAASYLVASHTERGELERAEHVLTEAGLAGEVDLGTNFAGILLFHRARLRAAEGRDEDALADFRAQIDWEAAVGRRTHGMQARAYAAPLLAAQGAGDAARGLAEAEWDAVRDVSVPRWPGVALRALAAVRKGDEAIELLRDSVEVLSRSAARLELARSLLELGAALRRSNRRRDARTPLREALGLAHQCGALVLERAARDELRAAGGRPRAAVLGGVDALTPSELRIARMAADGMSNPEIAQALFVTRKNVENHLGRAYGKLAIKSRKELPEALAR